MRTGLPPPRQLLKPARRGRSQSPRWRPSRAGRSRAGPGSRGEPAAAGARRSERAGACERERRQTRTADEGKQNGRRDEREERSRNARTEGGETGEIDVSEEQGRRSGGEWGAPQQGHCVPLPRPTPPHPFLPYTEGAHRHGNAP